MSRKIVQFGFEVESVKSFSGDIVRSRIWVLTEEGRLYAQSPLDHMMHECKLKFKEDGTNDTEQ